jgi:hypothetical protein
VTAWANSRPPAKPSPKFHRPQRKCRKAQVRPHPRRQRRIGNDRRCTTHRRAIGDSA